VSGGEATPLERMGVVEYFRPGEYDRVEQVLDDMDQVGIRRLRTQFSWADWHTDEGAAWYDWLMPHLAKRVELLPCFSYTPPSLGMTPTTASPPREPKAYADFLDQIITRLGRHFEWVELWNEPNNLNDWDWRQDPSWHVFSEMIGMAASWVHTRGKKTVLGGMAPVDPNWLRMMGERGVLEHMDAVGIHGFPGTWQFDGATWRELVESTQEVLDQVGSEAEIWITEGGYSTWRNDEMRQVQHFLNLMRAPARRVYWYSAHDLHRDLSHQDGFHEDERHYHFGLREDTGRPKLVFEMLASEGPEGLERLDRMTRRTAARIPRAPLNDASPPDDAPSVLITGGAGFVGSNLAARLLEEGHRVLILDNLSRRGSEVNLEWLRSRFPDRLTVEVADIRDRHLLRNAVRGVSKVFHLASQVAVTTSLDDPATDFEVNVGGTLNVLEALRELDQPPSLVFSSTNKVYGNLQDTALQETPLRYEPECPDLRRHGVGEKRRLDFRSPYGCSKGAADQYVLDYARTFGLPFVVFRMSCIYGPRQFGTEDQGWVAHFLSRAVHGGTLWVYGDGKQVRDILHVSDLVEAFILASDRGRELGGRAFNIGGGPANSTSLLELLELIRTLEGTALEVRQGPWRTADQRYFVSDTRAFGEATGWRPRVTVPEGVMRLQRWIQTRDEAVEVAS
jgi:CDP-paratose 2-epimerase